MFDKDGHHLATYGEIVHGSDEGDGWLRVGDRYLPMQLGGKPVLVLREEKSQTKQHSAVGTPSVQVVDGGGPRLEVVKKKDNKEDETVEQQVAQTASHAAVVPADLLPKGEFDHSQDGLWMRLLTACFNSTTGVVSLGLVLAAVGVALALLCTLCERRYGARLRELAALKRDEVAAPQRVQVPPQQPERRFLGNPSRLMADATGTRAGPPTVYRRQERTLPAPAPAAAQREEATLAATEPTQGAERAAQLAPSSVGSGMEESAAANGPEPACATTISGSDRPASSTSGASAASQRPPCGPADACGAAAHQPTAKEAAGAAAEVASSGAAVCGMCGSVWSTGQLQCAECAAVGERQIAGQPAASI